MRASFVTLLLLAAPAVWSQEPGPAAGAVIAPDDLISLCIESSEDESGLPALEAACPGVEHALVETGYAAFISEAELERLSSYSLDDLLDLAARYREPPTGRSAEAMMAKLGPILDSLQQERRVDIPPGWFERFKRWLRNLVERQQQDQDSWLGRWLRDVNVPEQATAWILYGLVGIVILLAIGVIVNEVRAAGLLKRGARRRTAAQAAADALAGNTFPTLADLHRVAARERPSLLLRILTARLVNTGRLRAEKSLTHRELATRAAFDAAEQRERFRQVAALGERLLYGGRPASDEEIDAVVRAGAELDAQLTAPRVSP